MADGPGKIMAQREVAQAQGAMLNGKMSGCAMHLGRTMHAGSLTQASYASTMAPGPGRNHTTSPVSNRNGDGNRCKLRSKPWQRGLTAWRLTKPASGFAAPLPLAGEVDALERAGRVGEDLSTRTVRFAEAPHPNLPREERERERTSVVATTQTDLIALKRCRFGHWLKYDADAATSSVQEMQPH
jgi:hypothetical protein